MALRFFKRLFATIISEKYEERERDIVARWQEVMPKCLHVVEKK